MILSKIKKHFSLLVIRLQEKKTIKKMTLQHDPALQIIIDAFIKLMQPLGLVEVSRTGAVAILRGEKALLK